jgi:hypothetical protein
MSDGLGREQGRKHDETRRAAAHATGCIDSERENDIQRTKTFSFLSRKEKMHAVLFGSFP